MLEALWVYQHHDVVEPGLLTRLLQAKEFRARAAATRVLQAWFDRVDGAMGLLARMVNDPAPRVRLEAVRALSFVPTPDAAETALQVLKHPLDYYLQYTLDSTMTTLEKAYEPALVSGRPFAADNALGQMFVLNRLSPTKLASMPPSVQVFRTIVERAGIDARARMSALEGLARLNRTSPVQELVAAIDRVDGKPGSGPVSQELALTLSTVEQTALAGARAELERLALGGRSDAVRQGAFAGLIRADGSSERAWQLASASPASRIDLLRGVSRLGDDKLLGELYPRITSQLSAAERQVAPPVQGRYVRIVFPGPERTLRLAEVQIFSGGQNVARGGKASQSSIVAGGTTGGQPDRAIDGRTDAEPKAASTAFTMLERDPWWEIDLGDTRPIDAIALWNQVTNDRSVGAHVSILDASRQPVFTRDGVLTTVPTERTVVGGDLSDTVMTAAVAALGSIPGHETERVTILATHLQSPATRQAAMVAIRRIPKERWPVEQLAPLSQTLLGYIRTVPASERTDPLFKQAVELGREIATRLPPADAKLATAAIDQLVVRTIRIEAPLAEMKFSLANFAVEAGEEVEIEFVNPDQMPHNLVITVPGALESVSLKAEAMMKEADGFAKDFVPQTSEVLFFTKLIGSGESGRLRFTAPTRTGSYPYVCTFPGHWRTMNGIMQVVRTGAAPTLPGR
jgi:azurin/HEAT repeat protein